MKYLVGTSVQVRHRWQPLALLFVIVFAALAVLILIVGDSVVYVLVGAVAMAIVPFISKEFFKSVEKIAPIQVQADGIHTYDGFGVKAFVRWSKIKRIRKMVLGPGLKWLLLDDGRPYMKLAGVPVFVEDKPAFYRSVVDTIGEDHVFAVALRENGFGPR